LSGLSDVQQIYWGVCEDQLKDGSGGVSGEGVLLCAGCKTASSIGLIPPNSLGGGPKSPGQMRDQRGGSVVPFRGLAEPGVQLEADLEEIYHQVAVQIRSHEVTSE